MRRLPPAIGELTGVRRLSLRANWLNDLPPEIAELRNLVALDIADNIVERTVPPALLRMTWLARISHGIR
jgi:Leucine-rich repeat (LRR) protein